MTPTKTKVLILHTSVGHGIKATAYNIFEQLEKSELYEPIIADIGQVEASRFSTVIQKVYTTITDKVAPLWGFLYESKVVMFVMLPLRKFIASFQSKKTLDLLRQHQPAIVISTQAICTGIIAHLKSKGLYRGKLVSVFSDYHLHPFWLFDEVDLYGCNIADQALELENRGVEKTRIAITGLFLSEKFSKIQDREEACRQMGLLTTMPKVLLFSGARPRVASNKAIFLQLLRSKKSFQIIVICGNSSELKKELESISAPNIHPVKIIGYTNQVDILMAASDVMVGKTGGPTMGEAILKKLPLVITDAMPGHEELNLKYLLKNNIVDYGRVPREVTFLVEEILEGRRKRSWDQAYEKIIKPKQFVTIIEALNTVKPTTRVTHYQEQAFKV
jgi:processive 1,2-diacylglycerol beta-glucosyltransferase